VERTRVAVLAALSVALCVCGVAFAAGSARLAGTLGAVSWPVSTLLVSEVQTGGASASDEFAEITNVGASAVDLAGLELVYATSTGGTVTRKASWSTALLLEPGRHLFIANTSGIYAGLADATYSGGFAGTGGAIALRPIGGTAIDAIGWGDATNAFVEGSPMAAPAAGASIERKPGGVAGNTVDTNSNSVDWFSQASPNPQSLAAPPAPAPIATASPLPSPTGTAAPPPTPTPTPTPVPTATNAPSPTATVVPIPSATVEPTPVSTPSATPTSEPSDTPSAAPTAAPTAEPTAESTPTLAPTQSPTPAPTPTVTPKPTVEPTPTPTITATPLPIVSITTARTLPDGAAATIVGVLTTPLGGLESGRKAFIQDDTAGIALYLETAVVDSVTAGTLLMAAGTLDDRFAERTLRVNLADLAQLGAGTLPEAWLSATGAIGEAVEGSRVVVAGVTAGAPTDLADGLGLMVDDGSGQVRVIVAPPALAGSSVPSGTSVVAIGPVGQRDSSGTGFAGYRIHVTQPGDFQILPAPTASPTIAPTVAPSPTLSSAPSPTAPPTATPAPSAAATPSATPGPAPTATPRPSATPRPTATPSPGPTPPPTIDIVEARGAAVGTTVSVTGVVTAEGGRLGLPPLIAIADGTGGIAVRLPDGVTLPPRGTTVLVKGALADPYGQLELRPSASGYTVTGRGSLPASVKLTAAQLGEATEGRLAELIGAVSSAPRKSTSGDISLDLVDPSGATVRVVADGSSGVSATDLAKDHAYRLTGIVGQRASRKGALDGYRLYVRDRGDIVALAGGGGSGASPAPGSGGGAVVPISTALAVPDGTHVAIEGTVTAGASLLDTSGRRIVIQDRSAAIEILLPSGAAAPAVGSRLRVSGTTGKAWGAPRIAASEVTKVAPGSAVQPQTLHRAPAERDEWLLVRISGTVAKVSRIGDRWRAEVTLDGGTDALVQGQAGAGIPSTAIVVGRRATVIGIVRRPYPTASDRRFALLPRSASDLSVSGGTGGTGAPTSAGAGTAATEATATTGAITPDTDLATLADVVGQRVKVGGVIARIGENGFDLDDGTALARIVLRGDMLALLGHLRAGEAVAATGLVEIVDGAPAVVVDEDGTLVRVGTLGQGLPIGDTMVPEASEAPDGRPLTADSSGGLGGPAPVSLLALATLTALSVLATMLRRRLLQRRLRLALVGRLAGLHGRVTGAEALSVSVGASPAEHESA
jgi:Lamin Tail Domain